MKFDFLVDFAGVGTNATAQAVEGVNAGGRALLVGMGSAVMELSIGASMEEYREVL